MSSVQSLSRVRLFATPWTAARQASLSITNSRSLLKLMSIESLMTSHPLSSPSLAFNLSQHQGLFKWVSSLIICNRPAYFYFISVCFSVHGRHFLLYKFMGLCLSPCNNKQKLFVRIIIKIYTTAKQLNTVLLLF